MYINAKVHYICLPRRRWVMPWNELPIFISWPESEQKVGSFDEIKTEVGNLMA
jgi:hypothetical protein